MTLNLYQSQVDALGFDLASAVAEFRAALGAFAETVDVPAPSSHPIVELIVRSGEDYRVLDDTQESVAERKRSLTAAVRAEAELRTSAILSPARQYLARADLAALQINPDRTSEEEASMATLVAVLSAIAAIERNAALLMIEIEDLAPQAVSAWALHWEA